MDTSETYIKMCDCGEIQSKHKWEYGDWLIAEYGSFTIGTATFDYDMSNPKVPPIRSGLPIAIIQRDDVESSMFSDKLIWLPRLDQLQEMVYHDKCGVLRFSPSMLAINFSDWIRQLGLDSKASMEQLWFAFVMKEKYSKQWLADSQEWVKI